MASFALKGIQVFSQSRQQFRCDRCDRSRIISASTNITGCIHGSWNDWVYTFLQEFSITSIHFIGCILKRAAVGIVLVTASARSILPALVMLSIRFFLSVCFLIATFITFLPIVSNLECFLSNAISFLLRLPIN